MLQTSFSHHARHGMNDKSAYTSYTAATIESKPRVEGSVINLWKMEQVSVKTATTSNQQLTALIL